MINKLIIILTVIAVQSIFAQIEPSYQTDEIVVTGSKVPTPFLELTRSVTVIKSEDIKLMPVSSLTDLLEYTLGVDIKQRGPNNIQSDMSIRGSSFEQTLILLDGIKISDSQTGHHNLNIPISLDNIEKIEILKGQGSSIHGANALSGVVNIITKNNAMQSGKLNASIGSFGYYDASLNYSQPFGNFYNNVTISKSHSNGYRYNTGFNNINAIYNPKLILGENSISGMIGYQDKKFGANGFYSDKYLNQWEETKALFSSLKADIILGNLFLSPKLSYRKHDDLYLLDKDRPAFYKNIHTTNTYNAELEAIYKSNLGSTAFSAEYGFDEIRSSNLGNRERQKYGFSVEQKLVLFNMVDVSVGGYLYKYDKWGYKFWPGADLGIMLVDGLRFYANIGKSFRIPTFTELYYSSPAQIGNAELKPEEALSYEGGIKYNNGYIISSFAVFNREGKNLIDWAKTSVNDKWVAQNLASLTTRGFEFNIALKTKSLMKDLPIKTINFGYTYLETDNQINYISRYILEHLKNQAILGLTTELMWNINQSWSMKYEHRYNSDDYFIIDTKISRQVGVVELSLIINNLFNKTYSDFANLPMPGRGMYFNVGVGFGE